MSPKVFLGLLLGLFIAAAIVLLGDEMFTFALDRDTQNGFGEMMGVTKAGIPRASD